MLQVIQNSNGQFFGDLEKAIKNKINMRCIVLNLSKIENKPENWASATTKAINDCFEDIGQIFFHDNTDVTILMRSVGQNEFTRLVSSLNNELAPAAMQDLAFLYELPLDGDILRKLFPDKSEAKATAASAVKKLDIDQFTRDFFNPALLKTIGYRRDKRKEPDVLVVEDNVFLQHIVSELFIGNFKVNTAKSGEEALRLYIEQAPDVVFLNIGLPDCCGFKILSKILEWDPEAYVIMLSSQAFQDKVMWSKDHGAKGFVGKPFSPAKLFSYISRCPSIHQRHITSAMIEDVAHF